MPPKNRQQGVATLLFSIIVLLLVTFVSLSTTKPIISETKITNNTIRAKLAFEAAEAGLAEAISALNNGNRPYDSNDNPNGGVFDNRLDSPSGDPLSFDSLSGEIKNGANIISSFFVSVDKNLFIRSEGYSDDKSLTKVILVQVGAENILPNVPENPLISKGAISFGGTGIIYNPEGATTTWTGNGAAVQGDFETQIADPSKNEYPDCLEKAFDCLLVPASTKSGSDAQIGVDIIENDSTLANLDTDEFFKNFTGYNMADFKSYKVTQFTAPTNYQFGEIIWYEGDLALQEKIGCEVANINAYTAPDSYYVGDGFTACETEGARESLKPVTLVVTGDLRINAGAFVYGIVIVLGDLVKANGTAQVVGAIAVNGESDVTGTLDLWYNSRVLSKINDDAGVYIISGGWRDFE